MRNFEKLFASAMTLGTPAAIHATVANASSINHHRPLLFEELVTTKNGGAFPDRLVLRTGKNCLNLVVESGDANKGGASTFEMKPYSTSIQKVARFLIGDPNSESVTTISTCGDKPTTMASGFMWQLAPTDKLIFNRLNGTINSAVSVTFSNDWKQQYPYPTGLVPSSYNGETAANANDRLMQDGLMPVKSTTGPQIFDHYNISMQYGMGQDSIITEEVKPTTALPLGIQVSSIPER